MRYRLLIAAAMALLAGCGATPSAPTTPSAGVATTPAPGSGCPASPGSSVSDAYGPFGRNALTDVQFVGPHQGWVVGHRVILATTDGGATWSVQDHGALDLVSVDFVSNDAGWAVGLSTLLATTDGGQHWSALPEPCPAIRSVHFVSPEIGFAVAGGSDPSATADLAPIDGGIMMRTTNGGMSWQRMPAPADTQSVCFANSRAGWLGADGRLYRSVDGGRTWALQARGPTGPGAPTAPGTMLVQCADGSAWGLDVGPGAAMSQQPHIGYHASAAGAAAIFAEQYFPHPGVTAAASSPGSSAGPLSAISASTAVFIDYCVACGWGTVPWDLVTADGATLVPKGNVGDINQAYGASFLNPSVGWVVGEVRNATSSAPRIMRTVNGGRSWQVQYPAG